MLITLVAGLSLLAPVSALNAGDSAPSLDLPTLSGSPAALGSSQLVVWLPTGSSDDLAQAPALSQLVSQAGAQLVIIPVTGPNQAKAQELASRVPGTTVLSDPDGRVILSYVGEFIPGVCPNPNLFVISANGSVSAIRQYPGVPPSSLSSLLSGAR